MVLTKQRLEELLRVCNDGHYEAVAFSGERTKIFYRRDGQWFDALGYESNPFPQCKAS